MEAAEPREKPNPPNKAESPSPDLSGLTDEQLLGMRICDLKLKIPGSELESRIEKFHAELGEKNIFLKPICYLGDEWFCPEGAATRSEEHTSELQSLAYLVCRLLLEKKK